MEVKKLVTMPRDLWEQVQTWRFNNRINTSTEAVRQLLVIGLLNEIRKRGEDRKQNNSPDPEPHQPFAA